MRDFLSQVASAYVPPPAGTYSTYVITYPLFFGCEISYTSSIESHELHCFRVPLSPFLSHIHTLSHPLSLTHTHTLTLSLSHTRTGAKEQTYEQSMGMVSTEPEIADCYFTHDWSLDELKRYVHDSICSFFVVY